MSRRVAQTTSRRDLQTTWHTCPFCGGPVGRAGEFCQPACREEAQRDRPDDEYQLLYVLAVVESRSIRDCAARIPHLERWAVHDRLTKHGWTVTDRTIHSMGGCR